MRMRFLMLEIARRTGGLHPAALGAIYFSRCPAPRLAASFDADEGETITSTSRSIAAQPSGWRRDPAGGERRIERRTLLASGAPQMSYGPLVRAAD